MATRLHQRDPRAVQGVQIMESAELPGCARRSSSWPQAGRHRPKDEKRKRTQRSKHSLVNCKSVLTGTTGKATILSKQSLAIPRNRVFTGAESTSMSPSPSKTAANTTRLAVVEMGGMVVKLPLPSQLTQRPSRFHAISAWTLTAIRRALQNLL